MARSDTAYTTHTYMNIAIRYLLLLFLLLGMAFSLTATAAEPAGRLLFAHGDVQLVRGSEAPVKVTRGAVVQVGDTIRTGINSSAQLRLSDGAMIALRADSVFRIEKQDYNEAAPGEGSQAAQLLRGGMRAITGAIGKKRPEAVSYRTPVATIGVRGTVIDVIYVPPEGLPGLPDVPPGHYTFVMEGSVLLSNQAGELLLAAGEIGYIADEVTPPVLRPDLAELFAMYASLQEPGGDDAATDEENTGNIGMDDPDTGDIDNVLTETATGDEAGTVAPGNYAFAFLHSFPNLYRANFVTTPVTVNASGEVQSASDGSGDLSSFTATGTPSNTGSYSAGDSTIYWGEYDGSSVTVNDAGGNPLSLNSIDILTYIDATHVALSTADLPTTGSYTYNYVGGLDYVTGGGLPGIDAANTYLSVDFGNGLMGVNLATTQYGTWTASNQPISDFYSSGITLDDGFANNGNIQGRFVGSNAEGAMTAFTLDIGSTSTFYGVAAFAR